MFELNLKKSGSWFMNNAWMEHSRNMKMAAYLKVHCVAMGMPSDATMRINKPQIVSAWNDSDATATAAPFFRRSRVTERDAIQLEIWFLADHACGSGIQFQFQFTSSDLWQAMLAAGLKSRQEWTRHCSIWFNFIICVIGLCISLTK